MKVGRAAKKRHSQLRCRELVVLRKASGRRKGFLNIPQELQARIWGLAIDATVPIESFGVPANSSRRPHPFMLPIESWGRNILGTRDLSRPYLVPLVCPIYHSSLIHLSKPAREQERHVPWFCPSTHPARKPPYPSSLLEEPTHSPHASSKTLLSRAAFSILPSKSSLSSTSLSFSFLSS